MSNALENSLKEKIKQIAKKKGCTFNQAWQGFVLERFLARLSRSIHRDKLIFKGGMLLSYYLNLGRETTDLDFLLKQTANEESVVSAIIKETCAIDLNDGFIFELQELKEIDHLVTSYPGFAVSIKYSCGNTTNKINLDIGVGDIVAHENFNIRMSATEKGALFETEISLLVYPPESIFAEKLETACFRGLENSRMKDFHDLWAMAVADSAILKDMNKLKKVLQETFAHRGSKLSLMHSDFEESSDKQERYWQDHIKTLRRADLDRNLPRSFRELIREINTWLTANLGIN